MNSDQSGFSQDHLGVLDEVISVSAFDNTVNPRVEASQQIETGRNLSGSLAIRPQVGSLLGEERSTKTFMGVEQNSVNIVV